MSKSIIEYLEEQKAKDGEGKVTLNSEQLIELQNRVRHYLSSYEIEHKLNASEMAKILGYTPMHYSRFKLVGTFNKVASCLLFFSNFAHLRKMSLSEFIMNLENKPLKNSEGHLSRELWDWEIDTLEILSKVESTIRRMLTRKTIKEAELSEIAFCKFEIALSILVLLPQLQISDFKLAAILVKEISSKKSGINASESPLPNANEDIHDLQMLRKDLIKLVKSKSIQDSEN